MRPALLSLLLPLFILHPSSFILCRAADSIQLEDATSATSVAFVHTDGGSGRRYFVETVASGLATFDYDNDGLIDIYFLNGRSLPGATPDKPPRNALYRNLGDFRFSEVTENSGLGGAGYGLGVAVADYDNDGDQDCYVSNFGPNNLYRNEGDGTFTDVTQATGTAGGDKTKVGAGVCFLEIGGDRHLDLFVANYVKFSFDRHQTGQQRGIEVYAPPAEFPALAAALYRNRGDSVFADISAESGVAERAGRGMGAVCADYDADGDTDIFVANDGSPNFLFTNDGRGVFEDAGLLAGVAYDFRGNAQGSMGAECGDFDNDGLADFYVTAFQNQPPTLYRNSADGLFEDVSLATGASAGAVQNVTWGCGLVDLDNDGDRDLFIACGHLYDNVEQFDDTTSYRARNIVLQNQLRETGQAKFVNVSDRSGDGLAARHSSRGAAFDDLDNDGDLDIVVQNSRDLPTILRNAHNAAETGHHWLQIRLQGVKTNRDGIGSRVKVIAGDLTQIDEVRSGRGYQSHYGSRLHFGLGQRATIDRIEVHWLGGRIQTLKNVAADQLITIVEEAGE